MHRNNAWSLVLAGGEGSRLHGLTRNVHGVAVPKQYCSLQGGPSLLQEAVQRAATVAPAQRVCAVVAAQHRHWWASMLSYLPARNVIVQPHNRGTAHGILLPLLRIAERDPDATVVIVPADHYFQREDVVTEALRRAADLAHQNPQFLYLLGIEPEEADVELGYILPHRVEGAGPAGVEKFVEKPSPSEAQALLEQGALWNSFIIAASVKSLLKLFDSRFDTAIHAIQTLDGAELDMAYQHLRSIDFSKQVMQGNEALLKVMPVPACGWTDLGTPVRIGAILKRLADAAVVPSTRPYVPNYLSLAAQYTRLQGAA